MDMADFGDYSSSELLYELKCAAWNVLHDNPGIDCGEWISILIDEYPSEVADALGSNPPEVYRKLAEWWEWMVFEDEDADTVCTFRDWSKYFANERAVESYDMLAEVKKYPNAREKGSNFTLDAFSQSRR